MKKCLFQGFPCVFPRGRLEAALWDRTRRKNTAREGVGDNGILQTAGPGKKDGEDRKARRFPEREGFRLFASRRE